MCVLEQLWLFVLTNAGKWVCNEFEHFELFE